MNSFREHGLKQQAQVQVGEKSTVPLSQSQSQAPHIAPPLHNARAWGKRALANMAHLVVGAGAAAAYILSWAIRVAAPVVYLWILIDQISIKTMALFASLPDNLHYSILLLFLSLSLLPVIYTGAKRPEWIWGAFYASAVLLWGVAKILPSVWAKYPLIPLVTPVGIYIVANGFLIRRIRRKQKSR